MVTTGNGRKRETNPFSSPIYVSLPDSDPSKSSRALLALSVIEIISLTAFAVYVMLHVRGATTGFSLVKHAGLGIPTKATLPLRF